MLTLDDIEGFEIEAADKLEAAVIECSSKLAYQWSEKTKAIAAKLYNEVNHV